MGAVGEAHGAVERSTTAADRLRRVLDVLFGTILVLLTLPVLVLAISASLVSLRAWPLFTQYRVGRGGELFRFVKVRTLRPDVPAYTDKHQLDHGAVPPACRLMRRLHVDELPQLFLVLAGRMSLVGPRPEMACLHARMPGDFREIRTSVRPGCTGLWQVSDRCDDLIEAAPDFDAFYVANRTVRLDLWILSRTARKMLGGTQRVSLDDVPAWVLAQEGAPSEALSAAAASGS
jgi:lipopolysaccharide/colanic/teichoic acid biosynthesis glycosyltransferase